MKKGRACCSCRWEHTFDLRSKLFARSIHAPFEEQTAADSGRYCTKPAGRGVGPASRAFAADLGKAQAEAEVLGGALSPPT